MAKELTVFEPGLPNTPGWTGLSEVKKQWLQEKTSNIKKFGAMEGLASVSAGIELLEVRNGLEGSTMGITDYINTVWGEKSQRTGFHKMRDTAQLIENWDAELVKYVSEKGALLLRGTTGIGIKDLIAVSKELPAPKDRSPQTLDAFIENKVRAKLREHKSERRKGKVVKLTEEDGVKILFNSGRRIFKSMKGNRGSAEWREILKNVVGWWMHELAVSGAPLECKRIKTPDGMTAQVGRPRKKGEEVA